MSIEKLKSRMPDYAKDIKLNLGNIQSSTALSESQVWGSMLAAALASRHPDVTAAVLAEAERRVSPETIQAVKAASAVMAMNNVYYRSLHLIGDAEMMKMPARLRMNAMANPGIGLTDALIAQRHRQARLRDLFDRRHRRERLRHVPEGACEGDQGEGRFGGGRAGHPAHRRRRPRRRLRARRRNGDERGQGRSLIRPLLERTSTSASDRRRHRSLRACPTLRA